MLTDLNLGHIRLQKFNRRYCCNDEIQKWVEKCKLRFMY